MNTGPTNPFLAASGNAIAHGRCDQQDNTALAGPEAPSCRVDAHQRHYTEIGPCHFGGLISGEYPDGRRTIWSNGRHNIVKLDAETLELLAELPIGDEAPLSSVEIADGLAGLDTLDGDDAIGHAIGLAMRFMTGVDGVYSLLDCDHTLFVGRSDSVVAYAEVDPDDASSAIVEARRWTAPKHIDGKFVGMNITFDGRLVMSTDCGWVICLTRDFSEYDATRLPGAADASAYNAAMLAERGHTGYGWVRTSLCVDDANGIYVNSLDHVHKVVWTGKQLSTDETDGAWRAQYRNSTGTGSGTTPCLMGFGDEDRFVVIGDGDDVVNITLLWRDAIPDDWTPPTGAPSRRIAGLGPAHMGNPDRSAIQTEQSITVCGYGAMTVNNEPASAPENFPGRGVRLLAFFLGHHDAYTPHGLHKYEWQPESREFAQAWINIEVSSPNSVPFVSAASDIVYTCGTRGGEWTIEALDWTSGELRATYTLGGSQFNTLGSGVIIDDDGRLTFGNIFGKTRLLL